MSDLGQIKDYVEVAGVLFSMAVASLSFIRSSKIKQNDGIDKKFEHQAEAIVKLGESLQDHAREDLEVQTELKADLKNAIKLVEKLDEKTDKIIEKL